MRKISDLGELQRLAERIAGATPPGAAATVLAALFFRVMRHRPAEPAWAGRDRLILSGGHGREALHRSYIEAGCAQGPDFAQMMEPSSAALGSGLSLALGHALTARLKQLSYRVYVFLPESELADEHGWDGVMWAGYHTAENLCAIVDCKNPRTEGSESLEARFRSLSWRVLNVSGSDVRQVVEALEEAQAAPAPTCILCWPLQARRDALPAAQATQGAQ